DIAAGHVLAAARGRRGEAYLLGHEDVGLPALARRVLDLLGLDRPVLTAPLWADRVGGRAPLITAEAVAIAERGLAADCSRAVRELGMPQTPLDVALRDALAWFAREGYIKDPAI